MEGGLNPQNPPLRTPLTSTQALVEEIDGKLPETCEIIEQNLMNKTESAEFIDLKTSIQNFTTRESC